MWRRRVELGNVPTTRSGPMPTFVTSWHTIAGTTRFLRRLDAHDLLADEGLGAAVEEDQQFLREGRRGFMESWVRPPGRRFSGAYLLSARRRWRPARWTLRWRSGQTGRGFAVPGGAP